MGSRQPVPVKPGVAVTRPGNQEQQGDVGDRNQYKQPGANHDGLLSGLGYSGPANSCVQGILKVQQFHIVDPGAAVGTQRYQLAALAVNQVNPVRNRIGNGLGEAVKGKPDDIGIRGIFTDAGYIHRGKRGYVGENKGPRAEEDLFLFGVYHNGLFRQQLALVVIPGVFAVKQVAEHNGAGKHRDNPFWRAVCGGGTNAQGNTGSTQSAEYSGNKSPEHKSVSSKKNGLPHRGSPFGINLSLQAMIQAVLQFNGLGQIRHRAGNGRFQPVPGSQRAVQQSLWILRRLPQS